MWRLQSIAQDLVANHPHRWIHALLYARCVWASHRPINDASKSSIAAALSTNESSIRSVFEEDTLPDAHANVQRIMKWLREPNVELARQVLHVDTFEDAVAKQ